MFLNLSLIWPVAPCLTLQVTSKKSKTMQNPIRASLFLLNILLIVDWRLHPGKTGQLLLVLIFSTAVSLQLDTKKLLLPHQKITGLYWSVETIFNFHRGTILSGQP